MGARARLAREVELCVLPNEERARVFREQTKTQKPVECVWNVPGLEEIGSRKPKPNLQTPLKVFYGGSLSSERISPLVFEKVLRLHPKVELHIVGYATYQHHDLLHKIEAYAEKGLLKFHGPKPREKMWAIADQCEAALCLMPMSSQDLNMRTMAGASNKPFDAMARGLAVVVSDLPAWTSMYLEERKDEAGAGGDPGCRIPDAGEKSNAKGTMSKDARNPEFRVPDPGKGYGIAINPESGESIRAGLGWMLNNREKLWEMGERGKRKIQEDWNYERAFDRIRARKDQ